MGARESPCPGEPRVASREPRARSVGVRSARFPAEMANVVGLEGTDFWVVYGLAPEREGAISRFYSLENRFHVQKRVGDDQSFGRLGNWTFRFSSALEQRGATAWFIGLFVFF